jgi:NifU-like protein involved in Fe-S cluster formation
MHCSNLAADALHEAIKNYRQGKVSSASFAKGCCKQETPSCCEKTED